LGTYWTIPKTGGALYGEGQGLLTTTDGQIATWTARGLGRYTAPRTIWFRGFTFYQTDSTGSLASLNNLMTVFEFEVNDVGNASARNWDWVY
jgi:hypothetical protein